MELQEAVDLQMKKIIDEEQNAEIIEGYTVEKSLIMEAWGRYRPVQNPKIAKPKPKAKVVEDLKVIFSSKFITKMMSNMHLKIYED